MMNNSLSNKRQLIPTCSDAIAAHLLTRFLLSPVENACRRRDWQPETWRGGKMAGVSSCLSSICKKSKFPIGDMIVIKTNKKRTDECINQNTSEHRWWAAVTFFLRWWRGDYHISAPKPTCIKSAWASALDKEANGWTQGSGKSIAPAEHQLTITDAEHHQIINEIHANRTPCRHGERETTGTVNINWSPI